MTRAELMATEDAYRRHKATLARERYHNDPHARARQLQRVRKVQGSQPKGTLPLTEALAHLVEWNVR